MEDDQQTWRPLTKTSISPYNTFMTTTQQHHILHRLLSWLGQRKWQFLALFVCILVPLYIFGRLAEDVWHGEVFGWDDSILLYIYSYHTPRLDSVMKFISWLGYNLVIPLDIGITVGLLAFRRWRAALFFGLSVGGAALLNVGAKQIFARVRPELWISIAPETTFSFPSGHAMGSMALAVALCVLLWSVRWRALIVVVAAVFVFLVCLSRLYLGVHYPSDVLAGSLASFAWVMGLAMIFYGRSGRAPAEPPEGARTEAATEKT